VGVVSNASATGFTLTPSATSAFATLSKTTSVAVTFASGVNQVVVPANGATIRVRGLVFVNAGAYSMIAVRTDNN
jgi:formylmethanofuran dehydrogenase subunit D